jgi:hypothetical protein
MKVFQAALQEWCDEKRWQQKVEAQPRKIFLNLLSSGFDSKH